MSLMTVHELAFAVGAQRMGKTLTELYILNRAKVEARDPDGLTMVDATRALGVPHKLRVTSSGRAAFMGDAETARKTLVAAGMLEAPVAVLAEPEHQLVYAQRDGENGIRPTERLVHIWRAGRLFILGRFPGEPDRTLSHADLPDRLRPHLPAYDVQAGFLPVQEPEVVSAWLRDVADIAQVDA